MNFNNPEYRAVIAKVESSNYWAAQDLYGKDLLLDNGVYINVFTKKERSEMLIEGAIIGYDLKGDELAKSGAKKAVIRSVSQVQNFLTTEEPVRSSVTPSKFTDNRSTAIELQMCLKASVDVLNSQGSESLHRADTIQNIADFAEVVYLELQRLKKKYE
jgi:hypothetical protein